MTSKSVFFVGIGGSGMNAIARIMQYQGYRVSGSDREYDAGRRTGFYREMIRSGITLHPQDGTGIHTDLELVVTSTAVESTIPDIGAAGRLSIPVIHRSEALARLVDPVSSISVAGTSGKSTVTGMGAWALKHAGFDPTVINGAKILGFGFDGSDSDISVGHGIWAIFEADESDGSLIRFTPEIGILTNISKDHKPLPELLDIFSQYSRHVKRCLVFNAGCRHSCDIAGHAVHSVSFGYDSKADFQIVNPVTSGLAASCNIEGHNLSIALPGNHNLENAAAVYALLRFLGINGSDSVNALAGFRGIQRRFQIAGTFKNITVVDDFAHNPDKIQATMTIALTLAKRVIYVYQPHGFGPTRFLFDDLVEQFRHGLRPCDKLFLLPIFYAGGTAQKTVSSNDIAREITKSGRHAVHTDRNQLPEQIANVSVSGDWIIVMGARDPSLSELCQSILTAIAKNSCE